MLLVFLPSTKITVLQIECLSLENDVIVLQGMQKQGFKKANDVNGSSQLELILDFHPDSGS